MFQSAEDTLTAWILSDGKAGHLNQCRGLAAALGVAPDIRTIRPRAPWSWLPPWLWARPLAAGGPGGDPLTPPWPRLLIAAGRATVAPAAAIKRAGGESVFAAMIQDPAAYRGTFDLIAAPAHDRLSGANTIATSGAINRVTPDLLAAEAERFAPLLGDLPRPLFAVLVGGDGGGYRMTAAAADRLCNGLRQLCARTGGGLAATLSRRTGEAAALRLRATLGELPAFLWDGTGENPYYGLLALADGIVVTADSISMVSEACTTGKPVHIARPDGAGSAKFRAFHAALAARGLTRPFDGGFEPFSAPPLDDAAAVAAEIRRRMGIG